MAKRLLSAVLLLAMLLSVLTPMASMTESEKRKITPPTGKYLISQTDSPITSGVTESEIILNNDKGDSQVMCYMTTVAPNAEVTFRASYTGYYTPGSTPASRADKSLIWGLERTTDQAKSYESATNEKVLFAMNGDYYNMQTAQPLGYLIMEGNVIQTGNGIAQEPYFAVLKNGKYVIRDYGEDHSDVLEAISGPFYLVKDGANVADPNDTSLMPRNSIGVCADGTLVTLLADGRQAPISVGMSLYEMAEILLKAGCVDALYLDGGGSATYATVREGTSQLEVRNSPSDGPERTVSSALLMISTASSDGSFDHASLAPNNTVYTPGSSVQLSAVGVDKAGGAAELPSGLSWSVPAEAGTISTGGLFTAKAGYTGTVEVTLNRGNKAVGQTEIVIADIDNLYFNGEAISMDFGAKSDLGLNAKFAKRTVNFKAGDFAWEIKSQTEGVADGAFGSMDGNTFVAGKSDGTIKGQVTVTYTRLDGSKLTDTIAIEIGKMPVVVQNFEPNENGPLTAAHYHWGWSKFHYDGSPHGDGYEGKYPELDVLTSDYYSDPDAQYSHVTAPYRFTGNYGVSVPAAPIFHANGYTYYLWPNSSITTYGAGGLKVTSREDGAQVRSGDYALELNYDYSSFDNSSNSNFYMRYCGDEIDIDGYPTEVGVWIYAPEGTPRYCVWGDVAVWNGSGYSTKNLKLMHIDKEGKESNVIDWTGWMYCYASLMDLHSSISAEHPMKIRQGEGFLWLCYIPKEGEGRFNGTLYYDDYRFVYGTNLDDLINPEINSIAINGTELAKDGSTVLDTGDVEITALFSDPESQNRKGVDATATVFFIDGVNIMVDGDDTKATTRTTLGNGHHTVMVQITDGGGNTVKQTREFEVNAKKATNAKLTFGGNGVVTLGGNYEMKLTATGTVQEVEMTVIDVNTDFGTPTQTAGGASYGAPVVTFAEGVDGSYEFVSTGFKKGKLTLKATKADGMTGDIATVSFAVPTTLDPEVDYLKYRVTNISFKEPNGATGTGAYGYTVLPVSAYYTIQTGTMLQGRACDITVYDIEGKPGKNVDVYLNGTEIGKTDENGKLTTEAMKDFAAGTEFVLTAKSELGLSFECKAAVLDYAGNADALPEAIQLGATADPTTSQRIAWFTNAAYAKNKAYVRYMSEEEYREATRSAGPDTNYRTLRGECELLAFATSKNAAYFNTVTINKLMPDTLYYYWVGDGSDGNWSDRMSFRTDAAEQEKTSFYVLGDTQMFGIPEKDTEAIAMLNTILENVDKQKVDFGLQSGDFIDNGANYAHYAEILNIFQNSALSDRLIYHVLGNHEYYGADAEHVSNAALQIPAKDYYSIENGNVYIAVINNSADLNEAAAWLREDAAKSKCAWKFLSIHQPPYYTNVDGGNGKFHEIIPAAAEAAGIDVVFSGHDHSYARTEQLKNGAVSENGTTYMICGDLGEKSRNINYAATDTPEFHFAMISQEYDALYLVVNATKTKLTVNAYNLDGSLIDSFSKEHKQPDVPVDPPTPPTPPTEEHDYRYDRKTGKLTCVLENCTQKEAPKDYTGWAKDAKSGKEMYFIGGQYKTGWFTLGSEVYHFDAKTGEAHRVTVVEDIKTTCDKQGHKSVKCACGATETFAYANPTGHVNKETTSGGKTYYVCTLCGRISDYNLSFIDVRDDSWYAQYVDYTVTNGLFKGRNALIFDPSNNMSRAEFVTVMWRSAGSPEQGNNGANNFKDCPAMSWFSAAVNWAVKYKIVNGVSETSFDPNGNITREQIATILYRFADTNKYDTSKKADINQGFKDGKAVSSYAEEAMRWAIGSGMIKGDEKGYINPKGLATRAEVATMIMRFHKTYIATSAENTAKN